MIEAASKIDAAIKSASSVVVIQAENPDGDSLASALALEQILGDMDKHVFLYCPVQMPKHLRFLEGWDRVNDVFPTKAEAAIIVDTSSATLLERAFTPENLGVLKKIPVIVLDHHTNEIDLPLETINYLSAEAAAAGEMIYELAKELSWPLAVDACSHLATSIMFDSLGLVSEGTTARTIHIIAELVEQGVSLTDLDNKRRVLMKKSIPLVRYKGQLMQRIEYVADDQIAMITIPWEEIEEYSDDYNPSMLVLDEMRLTEKVKLAVAFKQYPDGKVTAKIRTNPEGSVADKIAEHFGGGGHPFAAGFKVRNASLEDLKKEFLRVALEELNRG